MSQLIPNENSWIGFLAASGGNEFGVADVSNPTAEEVAAALDLTDFVVQLTASTTGNTVPVPRLRSLFEPSIPGTSTGSFTSDMYRDDTVDTAYATVGVRGLKGAFLVSRFGGTGANKMPLEGDAVEVWPVQVTSAANSNLASGQAEVFTLTCAVPVEPDEHATVAA